jgi:hypothetical protein
MDVPALVVLQRRGVHHDQRRVDDRPAFISAPDSASPHGLTLG